MIHNNYSIRKSVLDFTLIIFFGICLWFPWVITSCSWFNLQNQMQWFNRTFSWIIFFGISPWFPWLISHSNIPAQSMQRGFEPSPQRPDQQMPSECALELKATQSHTVLPAKRVDFLNSCHRYHSWWIMWCFVMWFHRVTICLIWIMI
jgi:hypothetical protein